jgi:hypothetical protein
MAMKQHRLLLPSFDDETRLSIVVSWTTGGISCTAGLGQEARHIFKPRQNAPELVVGVRNHLSRLGRWETPTGRRVGFERPIHRRCVPALSTTAVGPVRF